MKFKLSLVNSKRKTCWNCSWCLMSVVITIEINDNHEV
ncbi:hypothetical protein BVRB_5g109220 [Beta vulgaris subsp. vulgaris]|nr:hypothetical protein BVRB_5g109220 [Beta vulgaris subsp. vulgaris]